MRTTFINSLVAKARENPRVFLVVGDLGYSVVEPFATEFPDRFLNVGIAEQNMTGVAAGLASEGYQVFTYSIANFPTFRCAEQIRNDIAYHQLPVCIVSVGGGLAYGNLGYSHHAVQDLALLRSFPGMLLACPGDPVETKACVDYLVANPQPSYLRLGKAGEPVVHANEVSVSPHRTLPVQDGDGKVGVLTTAATLKLASSVIASDEFAGDVTLHSMPVWNEESSNAVAEFVRGHDYTITIEDHLRSGGFGSFVFECLRDEPELAGRLRPLALDPSVCKQVGSQAELNAIGGLSPDRLRAILRDALERTAGIPNVWSRRR